MTLTVCSVVNGDKMQLFFTAFAGNYKNMVNCSLRHLHISEPGLIQAKYLN